MMNTLRYNQQRVLRLLKKNHPKTIKNKQISEILKIEKGEVGTHLNALKSKGLVERTGNFCRVGYDWVAIKKDYFHKFCKELCLPLNFDLFEFTDDYISSTVYFSSNNIAKAVISKLLNENNIINNDRTLDGRSRARGSLSRTIDAYLRKNYQLEAFNTQVFKLKA